MTTYFTSDLHINNIRIFEEFEPARRKLGSTLEEHNDRLISNWNSVVTPKDTVYFLGDFAFGPKIHHKFFLDRMNGYKIIVRGNHDADERKCREMGWNEVYNFLSREIDGMKVWMNHIPMGNDSYENRKYPRSLLVEPVEGHDVYLCGHVHSSWKQKTVFGKPLINVGVDVNYYTPQTLGDLLNWAGPLRAPQLD